MKKIKKLLLLFIMSSSFYAHCFIDDQLFQALVDNNVSQLEDGLLEGSSPNARDSSGHTLLHWAALSRNIPALTLLLEHGADINASGQEIALSIFEFKDDCPSEYKEQLLRRVIPFYPSTFSSYGIVLNNRKNFMVVLHDQDTIPSFAQSPGNSNNKLTYEQLSTSPCFKESHPQIQVFSKLTPLHWAILSQDIEVVAFLIAHGARPDALCRLSNNTNANMITWAQHLSTPEMASFIKKTSSPAKPVR
ncbi:ankyrin repeat domain-containing protein [Candidatus Dependentiae bacterium]|nr:ankyrin repeat domain-containing protein [Candidatus Dependentiae bacterium]